MSKTVILFLSVLLILTNCNKPRPLVETGLIQAGGVKIYYESQGNGSPLILLHAGLLDHAMWNPQVNTLAADHRVITLDLPAHGKSTGKDTVTSIADVLAIMMDSLRIQQAVFLGLSYGSSCVTDMVLDHPERVEKIILVSPGLTGWDKVLTPDSVTANCFSNLNISFAGSDNHEKSKMFTSIWCDGPFRNMSDVKKDIRDYVINTTFHNLQDHAGDTWPNLDTTTAAERVRSIKKPTLLIYGTQDVPIIADASHFLHTSIANSKETSIPGVAHMLNLEAEQQFNQAVNSFLSEP